MAKRYKGFEDDDEKMSNERVFSGNSCIDIPDGVDQLEVKKDMELDVVPYEVSVKKHERREKGELWYEKLYWRHSWNLSGTQKYATCVNKMSGDKCRVCEERAYLKDSEPELAKKMKPSRRQIFNVIDLANEKKGVQILDISHYAFGEKVEEELREGKGKGYANLEGGKTLLLRFKEKKIGTGSYMELSRVDFEKREDYEDDILDETVDLDTAIKVTSYDELDAMFQTGEVTDGDKVKDEDEDKGSRRKRSRKDKEEDGDEDKGGSRRKRSRKDKEEEEDDGKDEDKGSSRKRRRAKKEDEDEDKGSRSSRRRKKEEEEDDGKDEDKGSSRRRRKSKDGGSKKSECPKGHEYGEEHDKTDDCGSCADDKWDSCMNAG